ncbi:MAG TPA: acyl-CoA dehydrogenase family protein [Acidimicrobiales bacterium]|nr:acyl-CoA dehydrogenase family protein [Acidimicrobiales bacterium]
MDLTYPPEAEEFRSEIRAWLEANLPDGWFDDDFDLEGEAREQFNKEWTKKLYEGGWICSTWPQEYGGKGLSTIQAVVLNEEFSGANAPMRADFFGDTLVGPTILQWGTEEQKQEFLPKILSGQIAWCQGFSEPESGSDLASLKCKAELDGDEWVINGQKVWTTQAQHADYVFLLARTDQSVSKHAGISYLLVPMHQDGVEIRPIIQPDGSGEFNEVFFTDARCPKDAVVGGVNNGWKVAMTTLGFERGSSATTGYRRFERELDVIMERAKRNGKIDDPVIRQRLMEAHTKVQIMKVNGWRSLSAVLHDKKDMGVAALGATNKMFWSEYHRDVMELAMDILGMDAQILTGDSGEDNIPGMMRSGRGRDDYPVSPLQAAFFFSRSETIWGGTAEVQRNIVGERVLGLPKEPKAESEKRDKEKDQAKA